MSMSLHTDRADRTVGDRDNFGRIWGWVAALIFVAVLLTGWDDRMIEGPGGWAVWTGLAGMAGVFPGVMIAALVKGVSIFFFED